jgi:hypothetical protein
MSYDNSASNPNRSKTKTGSAKPAKGKATKAKTTKPSKPKATAPLYSWDGGPAVHSIDQRTHGQNVAAQGYGIDLNANPLSRPAFAEAQGMAQAEYAPQIRAGQQMGANVQPWFQSYLDRSIGAQKAAQAYAAPIVQQAQTWANAAPQAAPGLDPSSAAYGQSQQAATSGQSLAKLGADTLAVIPLATNAYMSGQQDTAARQVAPAQAFYGQQVAGLQSDQAAKTAGYYGQNLQNAQNAQIAQQTLGVNAANQQADNQLAAQTAAQDAKDKRAARVVSRKNTRDRVAATTQRQKATAQTQAERQAAKDKAAADKTAATKKAADDKRIAGVHKATGDFQARIGDAVGDWNRVSKEPFPYQEEKVQKVNGKDKVVKVNKSRPATDAEVRGAMRKQGYTAMEIHIALLRRVNKPLDQAAIDYMHGKGLRIPREWLGGKTYNQRVKDNEVAGPSAPGRR